MPDMNAALRASKQGAACGQITQAQSGPVAGFLRCGSGFGHHTVSSPSALRAAATRLRRNMLVYGLGGVLLPFAAIKAIDLLHVLVLGA